MPKKTPLNRSQLRSLVSAQASPRDKLILLLSGLLGLRTCEISRLSQSHVIRDQLNRPIALKIIGKGRKQADQALLIPPVIAPLIPDYPGPLLTSNRRQSRGSRLTTRGVQWLISQALKRKGLAGPRITPHSLRHTAAAIAISIGASLEEIRQLLRHRNTATTTAYLHLLTNTLPSSLESRIAEAVYPIAGDRP